MLRAILSKFRSSNCSGRQAHTASVSEAAVEVYLDAARPEGVGSKPDALADLSAQAHRCSALVTAAPKAYPPARLAHTAAAVTAQLARMGDEVQGFIAYYWPSHGAPLAAPAAEHLWAAARQLAYTAGLIDVAAPCQHMLGTEARTDPLAGLVETARACADQVCDSDEDDEGPAAVARAIAQALAALEGVFAPVHAWITAYMPGRGRELPDAARHHLAEATGRWAPIAGHLTYIPAEVIPEPEAPEADASDSSGEQPESAKAESSQSAADQTVKSQPMVKAPAPAKKASKKKR